MILRQNESCCVDEEKWRIFTTFANESVLQRSTNCEVYYNNLESQGKGTEVHGTLLKRDNSYNFMRKTETLA